MANQNELLAEKRTHLAEKRTELAQERTMMSFIRTGTTVVLFGIAFFGFSDKNQFFIYAGVRAIAAGIIMIGIAIHKSIKHTMDIHNIREFFGKMIKHKFKK